MKEMTPDDAIKYSIILSQSRKTFHVNPFFLTHCYLQDENGETLVLERDDLEQDTFDLVSIPENIENLRHKCLIYLFEDEIKVLEDRGIKIKSKNIIGPEFFYKTSDFITMAGPEFARFRKKVNRFIRDYNPVVLNEYPKEKAVEFINNWATGKDTSEMSTLQKTIFDNGTKYSLEYLELADNLQSKSFYVEINGVLAGLRITCPLTEDLWCGVMQKVDYMYKDLARYLYHIAAKEYSGVEYFTTGGGALIESLDQYKTNMHPAYTKDIYFVITE